MDILIVDLIVAILLCILLHELLHIVALKYYGVEIVGIFLLNYGIGGLGPWPGKGVNKVLYRNRRLVVTFLAPAVLSPLALFPEIQFLWFMGLFNIFASVGDYSTLALFLKTPKQMRMAKEHEFNARYFNSGAIRIFRFRRSE